jgi:4-amino-4-deoxy-L-arabinose transferase-like glycosyltransferase
LTTAPRDSEIAGRRDWIAAVLVPSIVLAGINVIKPLVVDDSAYYAFAAQIAQSPFDPYGFDIHWYDHPQHAFTVLAPPVLPYWWAISIRLFGDEPWIAKMWLWPWCFVLSAAVFSLARRFATSIAVAATWMIALSPSVLPSLNLMLDVPALALSLAALAVFLSGRSAVIAGVLAGLAMQTKYSALIVPLTIALAGALNTDRTRQIRRAAIAVIFASLILAGWEIFVAAKYGQSHFLFHSAHQPAGWLRRDGLISPLIGLLGSVAAPVVVLRLAMRGYSWKSLMLSAGILGAGLAAIAVWPRFEGTLWTPTAVVFGLFGVAVAAAILASLRDLARSAITQFESRFLMGWLIIEVVGYFALTPWPAVRRVIGVVAVSTLVVAGSAPTSIDMRKVWFAVFCNFGLALLYQGIEIENGQVERDAVAALEAQFGQSQSPVWFVGHRGWQHYAEREGWRHFDSQRSAELQAGDWLLVPDFEFTGRNVILPSSAERIDSIEFWSRWRLGTIPWYYGTNAAVRRRDGPVVTVQVYRIH